jgi:peptide/nickel transport system substrate-binding protein
MILHPLSMRKTSLGMLLLSCLMVLVVMLSACGGTASPTSHKQGPLTIVGNTNGDFTRVFNPYNPNYNIGAQGMIYETLLYFNRLDGSIKPWLASSYSVSTDATVETFHLRPGVKWSDGQPLTSDDVVFTFNLLKKYPAMDTNGIWQSLKSVTATNASTVVVTLNTSFSPLLWYVAGQTYILSKHAWSQVKGDASNYADPNPIGTGPYTLKTFTPQLYTLAKNPNFWLPGKPEVNQLNFPAYNSNTSAELALDRGKVDWAGLFVPNLQQTFVSRDPAHNHYWFPASDMVLLYLNTAKYPFNLLPVRQAISYAIDRQKLYKIGESGYEPVASPTGLVLPENKSYLSPDYANTNFTLDPNKSVQLLQSAGFTRGSDGIFADKNGKKLSFTINVVEGWTDWITDCQIMASDLKAVGINVTVNTMSQDAWYNALQMGTYSASMLWTNPGPTPYFIYDGLLRSTNTAPIGQQANSNMERWNDPTTDKLLNQFATSTDPTVQKNAIIGLQKIMVEQLPSIPLTNEPYWNEYTTTHFIGWPDASNPYAVPSNLNAPDCEIVLLNLHPVG